MYRFPLIFSIFITVAACNQTQSIETNEVTTSETKENKVRDGEKKMYHKNGKLRAVVNYKEGLKDGLAMDYYESGIQRIEINYKNGKRHGDTKLFYEDGKLHKLTPYQDDLIHGIEKRYRANGDIMSEAPFFEGNPGLGLVEYTLKNKPKINYGEIIIKEIDKLAFNNEFILELTLSEKVRDLNFIFGDLENGKFIHGGLEYLPMNNNKGTYLFKVPQGQFLMGVINVVAVYKTNQGNWCVLNKKYNMAIEN